MITGGLPVHSVWTMTSTSEMSGSASREIWRRLQMPASTSMSVPVKTRKRLRAHQSIQRASMSHPSRCVDAELLGSDGLPVFLCGNGDLPGAAAPKLARSLVQAVTFVGTLHVGSHGRHSHSGHRRHEEGYGDLSACDGRTLRVRKLHAENIASLARRVRLRSQGSVRLGGIHCRSVAGTRRRGRIRAERSLQLAL